jgi:hypothetical protein
MKIPTGWIDKFNIEEGWTFIDKIRNLPPDTQNIINDIVGFVERSLTKHPPQS